MLFDLVYLTPRPALPPGVAALEIRAEHPDQIQIHHWVIPGEPLAHKEFRIHYADWWLGQAAQFHTWNLN